jgi:hypothetical protein
MENAFIYALVDHRCGELFYVGKANVPQRRLRYHLYSSQKKNNVELARRIEEIKNCGLKPIMVILEECGALCWKEKECYWIAKLRGEGAALLNISAGGNGAISGFTGSHSDATKEIIRQKHREQFSDPVRKERHRSAMKAWARTEAGQARLRENSKALAPFHDHEFRSKVSKNHWDSMTPEQRAEFCEMRKRRIYESRQEKTPEQLAEEKDARRANGQKGFAASAAGRRSYWDSLTPEQRQVRCAKLIAARRARCA